MSRAASLWPVHSGRTAVFTSGATAQAPALPDITCAIDADWNVLSGGFSTMSATELTAAIQQYLAVGSANSSG